jgi:hypothetical protein
MVTRRAGQEPAFPLQQVHALLKSGGPNAYRITENARVGAEFLYMDADDIIECVSDLTESDYEQTLASTKQPGTFQDVYKPRFHGYRIYLKLRVLNEITVIVISFKQNTSP